VKTVEHKAAKGSTLTLDELAAFVDDARRSGATGGEIVSVTASWGGKIQKLAVEVQAGAEPVAPEGRIETTKDGTLEVVPWTKQQVEEWNRTGRTPRPDKA
jgi:hypothetical protein